MKKQVRCTFTLCDFLVADKHPAKSVAATVEDAPEELPEINETTVESFSEQVHLSSLLCPFLR
jgi:hypothetical protein